MTLQVRRCCSQSPDHYSQWYRNEGAGGWISHEHRDIQTSRDRIDEASCHPNLYAQIARFFKHHTQTAHHVLPRQSRMDSDSYRPMPPICAVEFAFRFLEFIEDPLTSNMKRSSIFRDGQAARCAVYESLAQPRFKRP